MTTNCLTNSFRQGAASSVPENSAGLGAFACEASKRSFARGKNSAQEMFS